MFLRCVEGQADDDGVENGGREEGKRTYDRCVVVHLAQEIP